MLVGEKISFGALPLEGRLDDKRAADARQACSGFD